MALAALSSALIGSALIGGLAEAQDGGVGRSDAAITGRSVDATSLAEAGIPDAGAIPSYGDLPAPSLPVLINREGPVASLQPRGAATLVGVAALDGDRLRIDLIGASAGDYRVRIVASDRCPASPAPSEMVTGEVDEAQRSRPAPALADRGTVVGEVRVGDDGRGRFELPVGRRDLPKNAKSIAVLLEERPGAVNPSIADPLGLVACGALSVAAAG